MTVARLSAGHIRLSMIIPFIQSIHCKRTRILIGHIAIRIATRLNWKNYHTSVDGLSVAMAQATDCPKKTPIPSWNIHNLNTPSDEHGNGMPSPGAYRISRNGNRTQIPNKGKFMPTNRSLFDICTFYRCYFWVDSVFSLCTRLSVASSTHNPWWWESQCHFVFCIFVYERDANVVNNFAHNSSYDKRTDRELDDLR